MRVLKGYQDTRTNKEDLAITPYLFLVYYNNHIKVFGVGICWIWFSFYLGMGFNVPKNIPSFIIHKK